MKILKIEFLIQKGSFVQSSELRTILDQVKKAICSATWPQGSDRFVLHPVKKANGVVPIQLFGKRCVSSKGNGNKYNRITRKNDRTSRSNDLSKI